MKEIGDLFVKASVDTWAKESARRAITAGVWAVAYAALGWKGILYWIAGYLASFTFDFLVKCLELKINKGKA